MKADSRTSEMNNFNNALRQVMQVSKPQLNALLKDEKAIASIHRFHTLMMGSRNKFGMTVQYWDAIFQLLIELF